jgi:hypothetical protein
VKRHLLLISVQTGCTRALASGRTMGNVFHRITPLPDAAKPAVSMRGAEVDAASMPARGGKRKDTIRKD